MADEALTIFATGYGPFTEDGENPTNIANGDVAHWATPSPSVST